MDEDRITYFAETDARNKRVKFGIKAKDRTRHVYVIGKTGMGKSTLLENMAVQDIQNGEGMAFIDPHGKSTDLLMEYVPKDRIRDVIVIAPFDTEYPISFNVLESIDPHKRHLVVSGLMSTFKKIWEDAWSARMEYILTNTLLALLEAPGTTLLGVNRMLSDKAYRNEIVSHVQDPSVKAFWTKEFASYTERQAAEAVPAIQNKVGQFTANPLIRNMIGQPVSSFDFRKAMDERKIVIINLSKGRIGDENMKLLGGLLVTKIYLAAMSRADMPDRVVKMLPNFYLFVDEFQNFANASFADILSEARKYKLNLTIAHQYVEQMDENVSAAVFGNVGTMIVFRVGANDAEVLENEFTPQFTIEDLVNLGQYQIYLKLMIDGLTSPPFSATNMPPIAQPAVHYVNEIIAASREQFSRPRAEVEEAIIKFHEAVVAPAKTPVAAKAPASAKTPSPTKASEDAKAPVADKVVAPAKDPAVAKVPVPIKNSVAVKTVAPIKVSVSTIKDPVVVHAKAPAKVVPPEVVKMPMSDKVSIPVKPVPEIHHPFKEAFSAIHVAPTLTSKPDAKPDIPVAAKEPVLVKPSPSPLHLSSLGNKPTSKKIDPKVPTAENVSQLKNALAAALAKHHHDVKPIEPVSAPAKSAPQNIQPSMAKKEPGPQLIKQPIIEPVVQAKESPEQSTSSTTQTREVPEEVLKRVLKED